MGNGFNLSLRKAVRDGLVTGKYRVEIPNRDILVSAAGAAIGFGALPLDDFPAGKRIVFHGIRFSLGFQRMDTNLIATWSGDWSLGTQPNTDTDLADATDFDLIAAQAIGPANASGLIAAVETVVAGPAARTWASNEEINLNMIVDAADITDGATARIRVSGFIDFHVGII